MVINLFDEIILDPTLGKDDILIKEMETKLSFLNLHKNNYTKKHFSQPTEITIHKQNG